jgi:hypothetical protein
MPFKRSRSDDKDMFNHTEASKFNPPPPKKKKEEKRKKKERRKEKSSLSCCTFISLLFHYIYSTLSLRVRESQRDGKGFRIYTQGP